MLDFFTWLENSPASLFMREDYFAYFVALIFHAWGMAFLIGGGLALSLRAMGLASAIPVARFRVLIPWMWFGAVMAVLSGIGLLLGYPAKALTNPIFALKFACLIGAALVVRRIARMYFLEGAEQAGLARYGAAALVLWLGGVACGKLLLYTNTVLLVTNEW